MDAVTAKEAGWIGSSATYPRPITGPAAGTFTSRPTKVTDPLDAVRAMPSGY
jgi:hypothetical protein